MNGLVLFACAYAVIQFSRGQGFALEVYGALVVTLIAMILMAVWQALNDGRK